MNTPRIGDIVHYATIPTDHTTIRCHAAINLAEPHPTNGREFGELNLRVFNPHGNDFPVIAPYDHDGAHIISNNDPDDPTEWEIVVPYGDHFTPGTWHHIH